MSRRRLHQHKCPSGKVRYRTEGDASDAMAMVRRKRHSGHIEQRYYWCGRCKGYHLTSQQAHRSEL
jgi:hypothetical protein